MKPTDRQLSVLRTLRGFYEVRGNDQVGIEEVADEAGLSQEECANVLESLNEAGMVDWHFYMADPWYGSSSGRITPRGLSLTESESFGNRGSRFLREFIIANPGWALAGLALIITLLLWLGKILYSAFV